jgi:hypothetical protein
MASGKSRNKNRSAASQAPKQAPKQAPVAAVPTTPVAVAAAAPVDDTAWHKEYHYVFKDMRHLVIVSVALFAIIVVLGFIF